MRSAHAHESGAPAWAVALGAVLLAHAGAAQDPGEGDAVTRLEAEVARAETLVQKEPHRALWEAKMEARNKGAAFRDWAGWVMSGK